MWPPRTILGFFLRTAAFYALLVSPWHGLADAYRVAFRAVGNTFLYRLGSGAASAQFVPLSTDPRQPDTTVKVRDRQGKSAVSIDIRSGFLGFRITAFFVALVLASPVPWSRRCTALLLGGAVVTALVLLRTWIQLADMLNRPNPVDPYQFSAFWKSAIHVALNVLVLSPPTGYILSALIWALATLRVNDLHRLHGVSPTTIGTQTLHRGDSRRRLPQSRGARRHEG